MTSSVPCPQGQSFQKLNSLQFSSESVTTLYLQASQKQEKHPNKEQPDQHWQSNLPLQAPQQSSEQNFRTKLHNIQIIENVAIRYFYRIFHNILMYIIQQCRTNYINSLKLQQSKLRLTEKTPTQRTQQLSKKLQLPYEGLLNKKKLSQQQSFVFQFLNMCAEKIQSTFKAYILRKRYLGAIKPVRKFRQRMLALFKGWKTWNIYNCRRVKSLRQQYRKIEAESERLICNSNLQRSVRLKKIQYLNSNITRLKSQFFAVSEQLSSRGTWVFQIDTRTKQDIFTKKKYVSNEYLPSYNKADKWTNKQGNKKGNQQGNKRVNKQTVELQQTKQTNQLPRQSKKKQFFQQTLQRPIITKGRYEIDQDQVNLSQIQPLKEPIKLPPPQSKHQQTQKNLPLSLEQKHQQKQEKLERKNQEKVKMLRRCKYDPRKAIRQAKKKNNKALSKQKQLCTQSSKLLNNEAESSQLVTNIHQTTCEKNTQKNKKKQQEQNQKGQNNKKDTESCRRQEMKKQCPKSQNNKNLRDQKISFSDKKQKTILKKESHSKKNSNQFKKAVIQTQCQKEKIENNNQSNSKGIQNDQLRGKDFKYVHKKAQMEQQVNGKENCSQTEIFKNPKWAGIKDEQIHQNQVYKSFYLQELSLKVPNLHKNFKATQSQNLKATQSQRSSKLSQRIFSNVHSQEHLLANSSPYQCKAQKSQTNFQKFKQKNIELRTVKKQQVYRSVETLQEVYQSQYSQRINNLKTKLNMLETTRYIQKDQHIPVILEDCQFIKKIFRENTFSGLYWPQVRSMEGNFLGFIQFNFCN